VLDSSRHGTTELLRFGTTLHGDLPAPLFDAFAHPTTHHLLRFRWETAFDYNDEDDAVSVRGDH
jgi:hypothetical protein